MIDAWLSAVLSMLCLVGAAVASVAQISLRALGKERTRELLKDPHGSARHLRAWLEAPMRLLISTLIARVGLVALATWLAARTALLLSGTSAETWAALVVPLLHITVFEVAVGTWAKHRAEKVAIPAARLFVVVDALLWFPSALLAAVARRLAGAVAGGDPTARETGPFLTEDDMARLWGLAPQPGKPQEQGHRLLQGVLQFQDAVVRDVMVPRARMTSLDVEASQDEILRAFSKDGHTRLPVSQGTLDHVIGVLLLADVLRAYTADAPVNVRTAMRRPYFVPELMKIGDLLREFQKRRTHMAVVADEFGGTSGLVTLQDVVEEIVGDVRDEDDVQDPSIKELGADTWLIDGRASIAAVSHAVGEELPADGTYETVGGFLITSLGRLPAAGATLSFGRLVLTVKEADEKRVTKVQVERLQSVPDPAEEPPMTSE